MTIAPDRLGGDRERGSATRRLACAAALLAMWAVPAPAHADEIAPSDASASASAEPPYRAELSPRFTPRVTTLQSPRCKIFKGLRCDNGRHLELAWEWVRGQDATDSVLVFRTDRPGADLAALGAIIGTAPKPQGGEAAEATARFGDWTLVAATEDETFVDTVPPGGTYQYALVTARPSPTDAKLVGVLSPPVVTGPVEPAASLVSADSWFYFVVIVFMSGALWFYFTRVREAPQDVFIRRIPGVDAIEEAVGRSTEMGRPVLYVTGLEDVQDIQTIASLLILGKVAEMTADYDTELKVANFYPMTMVVAEEIVRQGYANVGRIDAHKPENVMFISAEQFAFAAGVTGLILRDRPATGIYLGKYFAESLIIAETGYTIRAIQIAGTAELPQLPFFIAACDYTLIGEELYAVSAYLSREPVLLATLKASDLIKLCLLGVIAIGAITATAGLFDLSAWLVAP